jgi:RimJ/RimL family protein N-acetyltransferase
MHIILQTQRLTMRQLTAEDVDNLFALNSDPEVMRYLTGGKPTPREVLRNEVIPFHLAVYKRFDRLGTWAAQSTAGGDFLGWFHFRPGPGTDLTNVDLGYRLRRSAWNKGYATEGSRALISMGFTELGVERVFAHTMTVNTASRRVMEKCGLSLVRTIPYEGADTIEGSEHGEVEYALTKSGWEPNRGLPTRLEQDLDGSCSPRVLHGQHRLAPAHEREPVGDDRRQIESGRDEVEVVLHRVLGDAADFLDAEAVGADDTQLLEVQRRPLKTLRRLDSGHNERASGSEQPQ